MIYHDFDTGNYLLNDTIENYLMYGYPPGGFVRSLMANDLFGAAQRADHWNKPNLAAIADVVFFNVHSPAIGSYEAIDDWIKDKDNRRSDYCRKKEKEYTMKVLKGEVQKTKYPDDIPF